MPTNSIIIDINESLLRQIDLEIQVRAWDRHKIWRDKTV